jgi:hypothetical protein
LGVDPNSAFFVLALIANAAAYGYWYLADATAYHEAAAIHTIEQNDPRQEFYKTLLSHLSPQQQRSQMVCFISAILAWAALVTGLTAAFVLNIGLLPGWIGGLSIFAAMFIAVRSAVADLRKHMAIIRAERAGTFP